MLNYKFKISNLKSQIPSGGGFHHIVLDSCVFGVETFKLEKMQKQ